MGFVKLVVYGVIFALMVTNLPLAFFPEMNAVKFTPEEPVEFKGVLAPNEKLKNSVKLLDGKLHGPESIVEYNGALYTGIKTGELVKIEGNKHTVLPIVPTHNKNDQRRFLGLRVHKDKLLAIEGINGLYSIDLKTYKAELLLASFDESGGKQYHYMNDLDIDPETEWVYISLASHNYEPGDFVKSFVAYDNSGSIIRYSLKSQKVEKLLDGLYFPNGVQLSRDGNYLYFSETFKMRIMKYHLKGGKRGTVEVLTRLPGCPDNLRPSSRGGYWVAIALGKEGTLFLEDLGQYPMVRKILLRTSNIIGLGLEHIEKSLYSNKGLKKLAQSFKNGDILLGLKNNLRCLIVEIDDSGVVRDSLQSPELQHCALSQVLDLKGDLYLASYENRYILETKLS